MEDLEVTSRRVEGARRLWLQPSVVKPAGRCFVLLDAELYIDRVQAPAIVEQLQRDDRMPPTTFVYLSSLRAAARHSDFTCNRAYASFLVHDLLPWIERTIGGFDQYYLGGLSLSGLEAAFTLLEHPGVFAGGLYQSPSAWWNEEWLAATLHEGFPSLPRMWISVGDQEQDANVFHPPTSLHQKSSQLESVRRLVQRLRDRSAVVQFNEFCGGHDPQCWGAELPLALPWLLGGDG